jgi:hypothetical protein
MTETMVTHLIAAIPPTIAALGAIYISRRNGKMVASTAEKLDGVHELVNSNLTKVKTDLELANTRVKRLEEMIVKLTGANTPTKEESP